jgi:stringent starvation protein B
MSEQSAKPYLVRALYEWCVDQGFTPFMAVRVDGKTRVPMDYVKNGEIVLNVGPLATHKLTMDNDWVLFNARFNGVTQELAIPFGAVLGIFAKETGYGMGFQPEVKPTLIEVSSEVGADPATVLTSATTSDSSAAKPTLSPIIGSADPASAKPGVKSKASLTVVK